MILDFIDSIQTLLDTIRKAISSESVVRYTGEVKGMAKDVYDLNIPTSKDDRVNLKQDGEAIIKDYQKAFEKKKLELHLNG